MSLPRIIGLSGAAGAGKDTVADHLIEAYGYKKISFAAPIKRAIEAMFDVGDEIWARDVKEEPQENLLGFSPRHLAQTLGTEWGRTQAPNFWVDLALMHASHILADGGRVVISDVRFNNEAMFIQKMGGAVVGIIRPSVENKSVRQHISEAGVDEDLVTAVLLNNGSVRQVPAKVDDILAEIREMTEENSQ